MNKKVYAAPYPQSLSTVFPGELMAELKSTVNLEYQGDGPIDYALLDASIADATALIGQKDLPEVPMPANHSVRYNENLLLSPHRAGGIPQAFSLIGRMVLDDLNLILRGMPLVRMQRVQWETVKSFASKPAG